MGDSFLRWERRRYARLLSLENKPYCLHSLFSQAKDVGANLGAAVDFLQLSGNGETSIWERKLPFFVFVLFLFLKEACRLHGLALAGLNLATSNWYNVDLDPCRCRGHRREGCGRRRASGNLRWLMESLGLCELQEVHQSAPGKRKRKEKKRHKIPPGSARNGICRGQKSRPFKNTDTVPKASTVSVALKLLIPICRQEPLLQPSKQHCFYWEEVPASPCPSHSTTKTHCSPKAD